MVKKYVTTAQLLSLFTLIWTIWLGSIELSELFCTHVEKKTICYNVLSWLSRFLDFNVLFYVLFMSIFTFFRMNRNEKRTFWRTRTDVRYMFDFTCLIGVRIDLEVPFHTKIMVLCERDIRDILVHFWDIFMVFCG